MWRIAFLLALSTTLLGGCYDGHEMVSRIMQRVSDDRREEVDLGVYQVTLPRGESDPVATTVKLDLVATIHRQNAREFKEQLKAVQAHLRHATIVALRSTSRKDLLEPKLTTLHERIEATTEQYLTAAPIEAIAFRSFAVFED
jgi:hypothetical protein